MSHYLHHVPGRLRVKTRALKSSEEAAAEARRRLEQLPGVEAVDLNTVTGSMLVRYDETVVNSAQILGLLVADGVINLLPAPKPKDAFALLEAPEREEATSGFADVLPKLVADIVVDKIMQRAAAALISAVI